MEDSDERYFRNTSRLSRVFCAMMLVWGIVCLCHAVNWYFAYGWCHSMAVDVNCSFVSLFCSYLVYRQDRYNKRANQNRK